MRIADMKLFAFSIPGIGKISNYSWSRTQHIFVRLVADNGYVGIGEGTPYLGSITRNSICFKLIKKCLIGTQVSDSREILKVLQQKLSGTWFFDYGSFLAVDSALVHLESRVRNVAIASVIGKIHHKSIPVCGTVFLGPLRDQAMRMKQWVDKGVSHIKMKIVGNPKEDIPNVKHVAQSVDNHLEIRVDANGAFKTIDDAVETLKALESSGVTQIEQPFKPGNLLACEKLRQRVNTLVFLDEEATDYRKINRIAKMNAADGIHIHPSKFGTLGTTQRMIRLIEHCELQWSLGAAGMTGIGTTTHAALVATQEVIHHPAEEVGSMEQFGTDIVRDSPTIIDGHLTLHDSSSHRMSIDPHKMTAIAKPIWHLSQVPVDVILDIARSRARFLQTLTRHMSNLSLLT